MINPHPGLPEFDYVKPVSLAEASTFLAQHAGDARPFSGGTDTFVRMRDGHWKEKFLVDIKGLDGTQTLSFDPDQGLTIGAAVNMNRVIAHPDALRLYPALVEAAHSVASYQLRNRATIVGNLCNASPAGDTIGACIVYQGVLHIHGVHGPREETLADFFKGPGRSALQPGDVVTAITLPVPPQPPRRALCKGKPQPGGRSGHRRRDRDWFSRQLRHPLATVFAWPWLRSRQFPWYPPRPKPFWLKNR